MRRILLTTLLASTALATPAMAISINGSTTAPMPLPGLTTAIDLQSRPLGNTNFSNATYSVAFSTPGGQGVVQGASSNEYAIPVAGAGPVYLTGNAGSPTTASAAGAGKYLSTGIGSITLTFAAAQQGFSMLWGSIDDFNSLQLFNGLTPGSVVGGVAAGNAAGIPANGFQGFEGSAYITIMGEVFDRIVFSSTTNSFEFTGLIAAERGFAVPTPASLALFGLALFALGAVQQRRRGAAQA
jgi:hypothetical protein